MAPTPKKGKGMDPSKKAKHKAYKQAKTKEKRRERKHARLLGGLPSGTDQTGQTAGDFVQQHKLSHKKNNLEVISGCFNAATSDLKKCFKKHSFEVYHCDAVLSKAVMAALDQAYPSRMAKVHRQMTEAWDQDGMVGEFSTFGFDLICLWTLWREMNAETHYELDLNDQSLPADFKHLVQRLRADLANA